MFKDICGESNVLTDPEAVFAYGRDQTLDLQCEAGMVIKPRTAGEVSDILKICSNFKIAITPRGGGSGVTGGALPLDGGMVLSLERLDRILELNATDGYIIAEAGVITSDLCRRVEEAGYFFPVEPSSSAFSMIGGNIAENAGSIRSCKYGKTGDYVLNLEVVLASGERFWTGNNVEKVSAGFDLTGLFVGSEGVLGVITKAVYRLLPKPEREIYLLTSFASLRKACDAVTAIRRSSLHPSAVEMICRNAIELAAPFLGGTLPLTGERDEAQLLVALDDPQCLDRSLDLAGDILQRHMSGDILVGESAAQKEELSRLRFGIGNAMTVNRPGYRDIDACVPVSFLYEYIAGTEAICARENVDMVCFGHAADGNMHTMLLIQEGQADRYRRATDQIYGLALQNGGVVSGEHGVGMLQRQYFGMQMQGSRLGLMKRIKALMDPDGILNPGKLFPQ